MSKRLGWDRRFGLKNNREDPFDLKNNREITNSFRDEFSFKHCVGIGCVLLSGFVVFGFIDVPVYSSFLLKVKDWQDGVPLFPYRKYQILNFIYNKER
jgi:hypothetical protein